MRVNNIRPAGGHDPPQIASQLPRPHSNYVAMVIARTPTRAFVWFTVGGGSSVETGNALIAPRCDSIAKIKFQNIQTVLRWILH